MRILMPLLLLAAVAVPPAPASAQSLDAVDVMRGILIIGTEAQRQREAARQREIQRRAQTGARAGGGTARPASPLAHVGRTLSRDEVRRLQVALDQLGHDPGGADGLIGARTRSAVGRFLAAEGLTIDGLDDRALLSRVEAAHELAVRPQIAPLPTAPVADARPADLAVLLEIQAGLHQLGYSAGSPDGRWTETWSEALSGFMVARSIQLPPTPDETALAILRLAAGGEIEVPEGVLAGAVAADTARHTVPTSLEVSTPTGEAAAPLALGRPSADLRALEFDMIDGVPILNSRERGIGLPALAMLVRLGQTPDLLERRGRFRNWQEDPARLLAVALLQGPARERFLGYQNFAGRTEIEQDVLRAEFIATYGDALRAMAAPLPFRAAVIARDTELHQYDSGRGGFVIRGSLANRGLPFGQMLNEAPDLVWRMDEDAARAVLADLRASGSGMSGRTVSAVVHVEVQGIAPGTGAWTYRRLHTEIYDADRRRLMATLPAPRALGAGGGLEAVSTDPERLLTAPPGIRPLEARYADGVLHFERWHNGLDRLFTYLRLRSDPAPFSDSFGERSPVRADHPVGRIMTDEARALYFARGGMVLPHHGPDAAFAGSDEFARADMRARFESEIVAPFLAWAPTPGVRFGWTTFAGFGPYSTELGGLPVQRIGLLRTGWRAWETLGDESIEWVNRHDEDPLLAMTTEEARSLLAELRSVTATLDAARVRDLLNDGMPPRDHERAVEIRYTAQVMNLDPETSTAMLRLERASVFDLSGRLLMEIPVEPPRPVPMVLADLPEALHVAYPPPLEAVTTARLLLLREGLLDEAEVLRLGEEIAHRDRRLHDNPPDMSGWHPFDARRPFWRDTRRTRADLSLGAPAQERFRRWATAYSEGMGDRLLSRSEMGAVGADRVEVVPLADFHWSRRDANALATRLEVWPDQILTRDQIGPDLAMVTPLRGVSATMNIARTAFGDLDPADTALRTEFEIERLVTTDIDGATVPVLMLRPVALWVLPPEAADAEDPGIPLAVIPLELEAHTEAGPESEPEPAVLDRHLADLLLLRLDEFDLPEEMIVHMAFRRLAHERDTPFPHGGRFFPHGTEELNPQALLAMGRDFIAWARALDWSPPQQVVLTQYHVTLGPDDSVVSSLWNRHPTSDINMARHIREASQCLRQDTALATPAACEAAALNWQLHHLLYIDPLVTSSTGRFPFDDPLTVVHRHWSQITAPPFPALIGDRLRIQGEILLDLEGVSLEPSIPLVASYLDDLALPDDHRWAASYNRNRHELWREQNPALVLDLRFVSARWVQTGRSAQVHESQRDPALDVEALLAAARERLAAPPPEPAAEVGPAIPDPDEIDWPQSAVRDIMGVRPGMRLADAEALLRGRWGEVTVYRADPERQTPPGRPYSSATAFVNATDTEALVVYDLPRLDPEIVQAVSYVSYSPTLGQFPG